MAHNGVSQQLATLSRRERQCLDVLFQRGEATVTEVMEALADPPSYSAVRATLNVLVEKGHAQHRQDGPRYVYLPTIPAETARTAAVRHLVQTFFGGSHEEAMVALLELSDTKVSRDAVERLTRKISSARKEGR
ncbi:MAG TPA: BlaI/MecI/CopY family transcriptional regulator [Gemmatimonadaceae bacterium]|nr:BlaI/MecI/CopY family transcriptional regulator [Gemmatimonadaceae bacterium]